MSTWKNIVNIERLTYKDEEFGPHYRARTTSFAKEMGAKKLGFHVESIPPKAFTCPYHFHHAEEELFLVLKGRAVLRQNGEFREVGRGDLIHFTTGPEGAHQFYNHTDEPFEFLALSNIDELDVCEYPDSGKALVKKLRRLYDKDPGVDYFKGEDDPRRFWPKERL